MAASSKYIFNGLIAEIPGISVDRFTEDNYNSDAYFLSHCHDDHMCGLNSWCFQNHLIKNGAYIYASRISCSIIRRKYGLIQDQIKELCVASTTTIALKNDFISVTPISSGHCPGSIMFLFESTKTILYTGDYRISCNDIRRIKHFYNSVDEVKSIDKIYLDTTFFQKSYRSFPSRKDSINKICEHITDWISKSPKHTVNLETSAKYGYEYLFMEIYKRTSQPVHVSEEVYYLYNVVPEMDKAITRCGNKTQVHCCCGTSFKWICKHYKDCKDFAMFPTKRIIISAMIWKNDKLMKENGVCDGDVGNTTRICYSTHASYEEGLELLKLLKPKEIKACFLIDNAKNEVLKNIDDFLSSFNETEEEPKLFATSSYKKRP